MAHRRSPPPRNRTRLALALAGAGLIVACAEPPRAPPAPPQPASAPANPAPPSSKPQAAPPQTPAPAAPAPAAPVLPDGITPGTPAAAQYAQRTAMAAAELLEGGNEDQANAELERALAADSSNKLASTLIKQIQTDPQTLLGREHFNYRVQAGESLSRIAGRFLGDVHLFYALARYNEIKVPRQLQGGQMLKVPGKSPPPQAAPAPSPPPPPAAPPPPAVATPAPAPAPAPAPESRAAQRERQARITAATRAARTAFAKQDLDGAIRHWDTVLELDPGNTTAQLERKKASDLRDRLGRVK